MQFGSRSHPEDILNLMKQLFENLSLAALVRYLAIVQSSLNVPSHTCLDVNLNLKTLQNLNAFTARCFALGCKLQAHQLRMLRQVHRIAAEIVLAVDICVARIRGMMVSVAFYDALSRLD